MWILCTLCVTPASLDQILFSMGAKDSLRANVNATGNCKVKGSCTYFKQENGACANVFLKILLAAQIKKSRALSRHNSGFARISLLPLTAQVNKKRTKSVIAVGCKYLM